MHDGFFLRYIAVAFIPSLSRSILSKNVTSFIEIIAESTLSSCMAGGIALFVFSIRNKDIDGVVTSLLGGCIGLKKLNKIVDKLIERKIKK